MEYNGLSNLQNTYPQPGNYIPNKNFISEPPNKKNEINLFGLYADKNKLPFITKNLSDLKFVEGTNFRFILAIFKDYNDTNPVYYTSEQYYNDLQSAIIEGNPYFLQASFDSRNIVSFVYEDCVNIVKKIVPLEKKSRIDFRSNIFITSGSFDVNYSNLVSFIDWLVDKPSPLDDENFGVLHPETIAGWNALDGNFATGEIKSSVSASYGIGKEFVIIQSVDSQLESNLAAIQQRLNEKLAKEKEINQKISLLKSYVDKQDYIFPFAKSAYVEILSKKYDSGETVAQALTGPKSARAKRVTAKILPEINSLNYELNNIQLEKANVQAEFNEAKKKIDDALAKLNEQKDKALEALNSFSGKIPNIPKIPKLPPIPKIPKLPAVSDVLTLLPLAAIPALPKLPAIPKFGKPKLPKLPKIKLKKPKEPKKVKKNKGKGLKGALAGIQNAANSVQGAIAGATAAAAGAVAAAQNAANAAQQQAAAAQNAIQNAQNAIKGAANNLQSSVQNTISNVQSNVQNTISNTQNQVKEISKTISETSKQLNK